LEPSTLGLRFLKQPIATSERLIIMNVNSTRWWRAMEGARRPTGKGMKICEATLAILIAVSAAMSGMAGFLSSEEKRLETISRGEAGRELNLANTAYIEANQLFIVDINCLRDAEVYDYLADVEDNDTYRWIAYFMRNTTLIVLNGYITYTGEGTAEYNGDYEQALAAYYDDMYASYHDHMDAYEDAGGRAQSHSEKSSDFLINTVLLAFSGVLATIGIVAAMLPVRMLMIGFVAVIMAVSSVYILTTLTG
jgi:hypothetical protein